MDSKRVFKRLLNRLKSLNAKIFRERKILIVSESHIFSIPLKPRFQQVTLAATVAVLAWSFYSNGRFLAYQGMIAQKEIEVQRSNMENRELQDLYQSLQSEMTGINDMMDTLQKNANLGESAKAKPKPKKASGEESSLQHPRDIRRYTELVRYSVHDKVEQHTRRLEAALASTGLDIDRVLRKTPAAKLRRELASLDVKNRGSEAVGGPLIPASVSTSAPRAVSREEMKMRFEYLLELTKAMNSVPLGRPLKRMKETSDFGTRRDPFTGQVAMHSGIDFKEKQGADVYATAKGKVVYAGWMGAYGNLVEIDHGKGIVTRYGHLSQIYVKEGDKVERYAVVGAQGSTGRSNGSHVHYEVRVDDEAVNPESFLKAGGHVY